MKLWVILLLFLLGGSVSSIGQNRLLDSLQHQLNIEIDGTAQVKLHNDIAFELASLSLYEDAKEHYEQLLKVSKKVNYKKGVWAYWSGMANVLMNENKLDEALVSCFELEKQLAIDNADSLSFGNLYESFANLYEAKTLYNKAIEYHNKALNIFKLGEVKAYEAIVLGNIATIYVKTKDYKNGLKFHQESLVIKKIHSSDYSIGTGLFNYAQIYDKLKDYQKTIDVLQESISYLEKCNDQAGLALCYTSLGLCYVSLSDSLDDGKVSFSIKKGDLLLSEKELLAKAFDYETKAISIFESMNEGYQIGHAYNSLATVLINQKKPKDAIAYYTKSYDLFKSTKLETALTATEGLAEGYKELKDYKKALEWKDTMSAIQKEMENRTNLIELGSQQANTIYQQEKEIAHLKHEQELSTANLEYLKRENEIISERDNRNKWLMFVGLILTIVIGSFFVMRRRLKTKNELLLASEKVKATKIELLESENKQTALLSSIAGEEKERERIALELHDGVASALTGIRLKLSTGDISSSQLEQNLKEVNQEIRSISHQLAIPALCELEIAELFFEQLISSAFTSMEVDLTCFPEKDILPFSILEKKHVYRIIQELFQNITKHAKASKVSVSYTSTVEEVNIIIEDNGVGFSDVEGDKGIGFENIKKRLLTLNGTLNIDTSPGRGTCVIIQIQKV